MESVQGHKFLMKLQRERLTAETAQRGQTGEHCTACYVIFNSCLGLYVGSISSIKYMLAYEAQKGTFLYPCKEGRVCCKYIY